MGEPLQPRKGGGNTIQFSLLLQGGAWLKDLDVTYRDPLDAFMGQINTLLYDALRNRTPVDTTTTKGKRKKFGEHAQESWILDLDIAGRGATISTDCVYMPWLEEGRYLGVGPRTAMGPDGKIYSRQAVGGIIKPMLDDPKILGDALSAAIAELNQRMDRIVNREGV